MPSWRTGRAASWPRQPAFPGSGRPSCWRRPGAMCGRPLAWRLAKAKTSMDKFAITGGTRLRGEIPAGGSKNAALPALAAALLTAEPVTLRRIPRVRDIRTMQRLLVDIGCKVNSEGETVRLETPAIVGPEG